MHKLFLSVIIPTFNNGKQLPFILMDVDKFLREAGFDYEIIVADAKSTDQTADIVRRFSALIKNLEIVGIDAIGDIGEALKNGVKAAFGEIILIIDPKAVCPKEVFSGMLSVFTEDKTKKWDVVLGKRVVSKDAGIAPRISLMLIRAAARAFCASREDDLFSGIRSFRHECATAIFPMTELSIAGVDWEPIILADRMGFRIKTIKLSENAGKPLNGKIFLENFGPMIKVGYRLHRHIYNLQNKNKEK